MTSASVAAYLASRYLTCERLAAVCGIPEASLEALIDAGLAPAPSYRADGAGTLASVVFGEFSETDARPGRYFHPGTAAWVGRALRVRAHLSVDDARCVLRRDFVRRFAVALRGMDRDLVRLPDCLDDGGRPIREALETRCDEAWTHLMDGTFGLCVADCARVAAIARKEALQSFLTRRAATAVPPAERTWLAALVDAYAEAAMPFAPPEYPSSSRRRLVEEFGAALREPPEPVPDASASRADV